MSATFFIGDVALDEYFLSERWPGPADKDFVTAMGDYVGGSIANAASVHAALGGPTEFVSLLNTSAISKRLCDELTARGVSIRHMIHDAAIAESRNLIFLTGREGAREHVVLTVDMGTQPMELSGKLMSELRQEGLAYTTLYRARRLRHGALAGADLFADLRAHGRRVVFDLDVGGFGPEDLPYLEGASVLIFNQMGYTQAFGDTPIARLGPWLRDNDVGCIIRTRAEDGAEAFDGRTHHDLSGLKVPVVDVTGAGDAFGGCLVHALGLGAALGDALDLAIVASARAVTVQGPAGGMACAAELAGFARRYRR
ncbi:MAG: hypothetical protein CML66_11765 [Rhodobacteraceae bacterium]|nr:hypothetical protein [Paracoccaceae bacterium]MAY47430.1 hypothetical protein [Paracoccaceae bacterium]